WEIRLPYGIGDSIVVLWLPSLSLTVAIGALTIWLAYRLVNFPKFADFLIATEAEMSKVTWMTRRRLIQDTIVVLVTVFLMSIFLGGMVFSWCFLLKQVGVVLEKQRGFGVRADRNGKHPPVEPSTDGAAQPPSNKRWYVVKVQANREDSIKEAIERR